jgi:hypothetical protein
MKLVMMSEMDIKDMIMMMVGNLGKTTFNSMIEGRNEEANGRKNRYWAVLVFTLCYENLIDFLIYIYIWASENRPSFQDLYFFQIHPIFK